jgi:recombination associated protein RdgC
MLFKNLCPYRLLEPFKLSPEELEEKLAATAFQPCGSLDMQSRGWVPPMGKEGEQLVHVANGVYLLCLREEGKILPASVVREVLDERIAEREEKEMRKVRKREREQLKEEITFELLPRAFTRTRQAYAFIDTVSGWLVVDCGSWRQAEAFTEFLRECLGTLPIAPPATTDAPQSIMTDWLASEHLPGDIELGEEAVFEDPATEGCEVRCKRQDLHAEEIKGHLKSGKRIRRLALSWSDRLSCVVDADYSIKRLKFTDMVKEAAGDRTPETFAEQFDADFTLLTLEVRRLLPRLMELFGGEAQTVQKIA